MTPAQELYDQQIRKLPVEDRLQLLALIAQDLAPSTTVRQRRITELEGLGKEIWDSIDAQTYVDELRNPALGVAQLSVAE
jgi:hypothetical protein